MYWINAISSHLRSGQPDAFTMLRRSAVSWSRPSLKRLLPASVSNGNMAKRMVSRSAGAARYAMAPANPAMTTAAEAIPNRRFNRDGPKAAENLGHASTPPRGVRLEAAPHDASPAMLQRRGPLHEAFFRMLMAVERLPSGGQLVQDNP